MPNPFAWAPSRGPCVVLVYSRDLWVQRVQWGAGNGVKVPFSTVPRAPTNLGVTCLQGAPWGLFPVFWLEPPAAPCLFLSRLGHHDAAGQGAEDAGQGVQPCGGGECCCALSFMCHSKEPRRDFGALVRGDPIPS